MDDIELSYIIDVIKRLRESKFTGSVQVNFRCGGITNINKNESILRKDFVVVVS